jgi:23S rRNA (uracil1939-C5)-methyltransferase
MEYSFGDERDIEIFSGNSKLESRNMTMNKTHLGLHPKGRFAIVTPTPECRLLSTESQEILQAVADWANDYQVSIYVRKSNEGNLRHLVIREGKNTGERMVNLVAKTPTPHIDELAERLEALRDKITTFMWTAYDGLSDVAHGGDVKIYWGHGMITEQYGDVRVNVGPTSFQQTNTHAAERMLDVIKSWMPATTRRVVDLYCGSGVIGLNIAGKSRELIGIELNKSAVEQARLTADMNAFAKVRFIEGRVENVLHADSEINSDGDTCVVVDPPRVGLHPKVLDTILQWKGSELIYISCNPETLARDLRVLGARYTILDVQPMDFFPHTDHIETAVRLRRTA